MYMSQIELNRPMKIKGVPFRRMNHAELEFPPLAKVFGPRGRIFLPETGGLIRRRSLGVAVLTREKCASGYNAQCRCFMVKYRYFPLRCSLCFGHTYHSSGRGSSDKNSKGTLLWQPKRIEPIEVFRKPGG